VVSASETTKSAAQNLGLETSLVTHNEEQLETTPVDPEEFGSTGVLINHTLRNGAPCAMMGMSSSTVM